MEDREFLRLVMTEVGPFDEGILEVLQTGDESWEVRFSEVDVEVEFDPKAERLVLSTEIGPVPEERRTQIYEALLTYNLLWRETGGLRMALSQAPAERSIIQALDLPCSAATPQLMAAALHDLNERTLIWREVLENRSPTEAPDFPEHPMIQI